MEFLQASENDFDTAFKFIKALWTYNEYDYEKTKAVYDSILSNPAHYVFFACDSGKYLGFCHCCIFDTLWMTGKTMYISALITDESIRGKGCGTALINYAKQLAKAEGCRAVILDSGLPRTDAHRFYEGCGFEKSCYGFELVL